MPEEIQITMNKVLQCHNELWLQWIKFIIKIAQLEWLQCTMPYNLNEQWVTKCTNYCSDNESQYHKNYNEQWVKISQCKQWQGVTMNTMPLHYNITHVTIEKWLQCIKM